MYVMSWWSCTQRNKQPALLCWQWQGQKKWRAATPFPFSLSKAGKQKVGIVREQFWHNYKRGRRANKILLNRHKKICLSVRAFKNVEEPEWHILPKVRAWRQCQHFNRRVCLMICLSCFAAPIRDATTPPTLLPAPLSTWNGIIHEDSARCLRCEIKNTSSSRKGEEWTDKNNVWQIK